MDELAQDAASVIEDIWTPQRIARFWDMVAQEPRLHHLYFSLRHAKSIINIARLFGMTGGNVMDYGCGPGYLSRELVNAGFQTTGIEYSLESANAANTLMHGLLCWNGCFTNDTIPDSSCENGFDWVFSVEAYEHLRDEWIEGYFFAINKYLKTGGMFVITVPNHENLNDNLIICPCCEAKFHRWGHLRSVAPDDLRCVVESYGFEVVLCNGIDLGLVRNSGVTIVDRIIARCGLGGYTCRRGPADMAPMIRAAKRIIKKSETKPHLILIARKL